MGNFFGINDEWKETKKSMVFLNKEQVLELFKEFDIISFKEIEEDSLTGCSEMKHWHIFEIMAKK